MKINDVIFNCQLEDVLYELQSQLQFNGIQLLQKMRDSGNDIQVQCPYHGGGQERKPSAGIRKSDGLFHCFACNETHSLNEVISYCFGQTDDVLGKFGWNWLLKNFATLEVEERNDICLDFTRHSKSNNVSVSNNSSDNLYVSEQELDSYRYYHSYWEKRGITDDNVIELFDLGYDRKTKCITFPIRDIYGHTLFVARRSVNTKFFNYPEGVEKPVYGLYELYCKARECKARELDNTYTNKNGTIETAPGELWMQEIIVCESMIDALTCWQYGRYAVALNGLGNELQFKQLKDLPCRKFILATDNDEAGMKARKRIRQNIKNKIITEYILPKGKKDINELTKEEFLSLQEVF